MVLIGAKEREVDDSIVEQRRKIPTISITPRFTSLPKSPRTFLAFVVNEQDGVHSNGRCERLELDFDLSSLRRDRSIQLLGCGVSWNLLNSRSSRRSLRGLAHR